MTGVQTCALPIWHGSHAVIISLVSGRHGSHAVIISIVSGRHELYPAVIPLVSDRHELGHADYVTKLPKGKHSVKGCGMTEPNPSDFIETNDGVKIPYGKGVTAAPSMGRTSLLYNEYPFSGADISLGGFGFTVIIV